MVDDFYEQLTKILRLNGCRLVRIGKHAIWHSPINNRTSKSRHTAYEVLKQAEIADRIR